MLEVYSKHQTDKGLGGRGKENPITETLRLATMVTYTNVHTYMSQIHRLAAVTMRISIGVLGLKMLPQ